MWARLRLLVLIASATASLACTGGGTVAQRVFTVQIGDSAAAVIPPLGIVWSKVRAPVSAGAPGAVGPAKGRATVHQIALPPLPINGLQSGTPLVSWGDASKEAAARDGGLAAIDHLDYELTTILMLYRRFTLIAYGEEGESSP